MQRVQEEQQVEEQKYLTIDELMPTWSAYLDLLVHDLEVAQAFRSENRLIYLSCNRCCVGEAWKWNDNYSNPMGSKYNCNVCSGFSFGYRGKESFGDIIQSVHDGKIGKDWRETSTVKEFVKHFNAAHVH
jgi:hypothetical protein